MYTTAAALRAVAWVRLAALAASILAILCADAATRGVDSTNQTFGQTPTGKMHARTGPAAG
jgi:hypothetical protein